MRRMFFAFLLLIPFSAYSTQHVDCDNWSGSESDCHASGGCTWHMGAGGRCDFCPQDNYCPAADYENRQPCPDGYGTGTEVGFDAITDCFRTVLFTDTEGTTNNNCKHYYNANQIVCGSDSYTIGTGAAEVREEGTNLFYANTMQCDQFARIPNGCEVEHNETSVLTWGGTSWATQNCRCTKQNDDPFDDNNCYSITRRKPNNLTLDSINDTLNYSHTINYYCTSCEPGAAPNVRKKTTEGICQPPEGANVVCNCIIAEQGQYVEPTDGTCSWNYPVYAVESCQTQNCPAGKTTDSTGSTYASDCHYTNDTQFCDAKGCFTLNIGNWNEL